MKTTKLKLKANKEMNLNVFTPNTKLNFRISRDALEMFIGYVFSDNPDITRMKLFNMDKFISMIDISKYESDSKLYSRMHVLKQALDGKLREGLERKDILKEYCRDENNTDINYVVDHIDDYCNLTSKEIYYITETVLDRLQFAFILFYKDIIINEFMRIDQGDYKSLKQIVKVIKSKCESLMSDIRQSEYSLSKKMFTLENGIFEPFVEATVRKASDPSRALITGIRMLNDMLSPGYMPGRLYVYLACSGVFKSSMLLLSAYWIKKYNRVKTKDPDCKPAVLFIVAENSIEETIIRLFNASVTNEDISNFKPKEVVKLLREQGKLTLEDGEINIIIVYGENDEYTPEKIRALIENLKSDKKEIIACVIDYLKRLGSDKPYESDRIKYRDVSNGLKDLAVHFEIPVITAYQLNRAAKMKMEDADKKNKTDQARELDASLIADCWDIVENSDLQIILNVELEKGTDKRYLTFKEVKKRYRSSNNISYFNHPFVDNSTIMLVEDVNFDKSVSKFSIASNLATSAPLSNNRGGDVEFDDVFTASDIIKK